MRFQTLLPLLVCLGLPAGAQGLVSNGNFQSGNTGFSGDYIYSPGDMLPGGTYCVVDNPASVHFAWASFGDHTSGSGLMLVVNGDTINATNTIWRENLSVVSKSLYSFSFWAASAHDDTPARFALVINGHVQATTPHLSSSVGLWQQSQATWNSGDSNTAQVEIRLANTNVGATDFVIDDIAFTLLPALRIETAVQLSWMSQSNVAYQVQFAESPATNQWFNLGSPVTGTGATDYFTDPLVSINEGSTGSCH